MTESKEGRRKNKDLTTNDKDSTSSSNLATSKPTSLSTLIVWNIVKALEKSPTLDIKKAIAATQHRLEQVSGAKDVILSEHTHERHLACALLAWQQLGHSNADSLYRFIENNRNEENTSKLSTTAKEINGRCVLKVSEPISGTSKDFKFTQAVNSSNYYSCAMGPVVKLPVETKVVMRVDNTPRSRPQANKPKAQEKDILNKIEKVCCLDSPCLKQLSVIEASTEELKSRAGMLAHRESERVVLLERAEAAWRDLETGYQRRLTLAKEKEEDIVRQISKFLDERTRYKEICTTLAQKVKEKREEAEKKHASLNDLEKNLCECACQRLKLCEESAKYDSLVSQHSCRIAQLDRDLLFREEEEQRKVQSLKDEVESARAISLEAERLMRAEHGALRNQIADVSKQLQEEDTKNKTITTALESLRAEKTELVETLDGCKTMCDGRMQGIIDELNKKRDQLNELKKKVVDCQCKMPVDVAVEVKRTPSFAAMCKCPPGDKKLESCSCTSMRTKLLSNLLSDLFGGLHFELAGFVALMPCQLLKCLEDDHNWDRSSTVKTNLKNYFSIMLSGELDIAIATSIEDYHIRWVGPSCADKKKPENECAIECHAQKMATQLTEQLFHEKTENITQCPPLPSVNIQTTQSICQCYPGKDIKTCPCEQNASTLVCWHQTMQDVTQLRQQVEDLKKDYLKKDELKTMENKFAQVIQLSPVSCSLEKDKKVEMKQRTVKKTYWRVSSFGGNEKVIDGKMRNVAVNETAVFPCLVNNTKPVNETPAPVTSPYWHRAVQDFTRLRLQIENLKKVSVNKEDLKMMGDKIAEMVHRASGGNAPSSAKIDSLTTGSVTNEVQNPSRLQNFDINNKHRKGYKIKSMSKNGVDKPFKPNKKNDHTYSVNLCLCGGKTRKSKLPHEKYKHETSVWKQKPSIDVVSQMSSSIRQAKPINNSFFSQDLSLQTYSKESQGQRCPSNCVCFHKKPSNTSIDLLLETLTVWKSDLAQPKDRGFEKYIHGNSNVECHLSHVENTCFKPKSSIKFERKSQDKSRLEKLEDSGGAAVKQKDCIERSNESKQSKVFEKISAKSTGIIGTTDSEYMGTVNLDKSNEEICKCNHGVKINNKTPFKCITSNKCCCYKAPELTKLGDQIMCTKKEIQQKHDSVRKKQDQNDVEKKTIITKDSNKLLQPSEKQPRNDLEIENENVRVFANSDYQIKFLGVTLADANQPTRNQVKVKRNNDNSSNISILHNHFLSRKESKGTISTTSTKNLQNHVYRVKSINPIPVFSDLSNKINKSNKNIITDKLKEDLIKRNEMLKNNSKNKDINKENEYNSENCKVLLDYKQKLCVRPLENSKYKCIKLDFNKLPIDQELPRKIKSDVSLTTNNAVSKMSEQQGTIIENVNIIKHPTLATGNITKTLSIQNIVNECDLTFDELKRFINVNLSKHITEDAALDVQSLNTYNNVDESCICCNKLSIEESKDLEDNAFQLLEIFLKKKLEEFKVLTNNHSCISQEQEEKIFTIILHRVKQLILDNTNQITCKCSIDDRKSEGCWKRAYGLLQEYIKMKIKKVQCSCLSAENSTETVLPDVLEKINNLIEADLKRLKVIYGSVKDPHFHKNIKKYSKQVNFGSGQGIVPKYTDDISLDFNDKPSFSQTICDQKHKDNKIFFIKQSMTSQVPSSLSMEVTSRNSLKTFTNDITIKASSRKKYQDYDQYINDIDLVRTKNINSPVNTNDEILMKNIACSSHDFDVPTEEKNDTGEVTVHQSVEQNNENNVVVTDSKQINTSQHLISSCVGDTTECLRKEASNSNVCMNPTVTASTGYLKSHIVAHSSKLENIQQLENDDEQCSNIPYIGYTINCCCHNSLGDCICAKSIAKANTDIINNIWKKSVPDETYFEKISYIIPKATINKINSLHETSNGVQLQDAFKNNVVTDNHLRECETTCSTNEDLVLIKSIENNNIKQIHASTNTFEENSSLDIVYSVNEDILDSCECSSHCNTNKTNNTQSDSERLKNSLYFPMPTTNFEDSLKLEPFLNKNIKPQPPMGLLTHKCNCEKVPICHVKMLVENIETKLANADCTCDSLMSKVCPVHAFLP